jgi:ribosome-binding protein aMBF1 (putative translation factor)
MPKTTDFSKLKKELLKKPAIKKEYDALGEEFQLAAEIIRARSKAKMTQAALAKIIGTHKSAVSRFESPGYNISVEMLRKVAKATGTSLRIELVRKDKSRKAAHART